MKFFLASLFVGLASFQVGTEIHTGSIAGRLVDQGNARPIALAEVTLVGPAAGPAAANAAANPLMAVEIATALSIPLRTTLTEADGRFGFNELAPGQYIVMVGREGYRGAPTPGASANSTIVTSTLTVVAGRPNPDVRLSMLRAATIDGRVSNPDGSPATGVSVTAYETIYRDGKPMLSEVVSRNTNDRGEYRLFGIPPGEYVIGANPSNTRSSSTPARNISVRTYHTTSRDARAAVTLRLAAGDELSGINISIRQESSSTVSGRMTIVTANSGPGGQPVAQTGPLYLIPEDPNVLDTLGAFPKSAINVGDGLFELRGVLPGTYDLIGSAMNEQQRQIPGRARVRITSEDVDNVALIVRSGVAVTARLFLDGRLLPAPPSTPLTAEAAAAVYAQGAAEGAAAGRAMRAAGLPPTTASLMFPPSVALPDGSTVVNGIGGTPIGVRSAAPMRVRLKSSYPVFYDGAAANVTSDSSGAFLFPSVAEGAYTVQVQGLPEGAYVADVRQGAVSIFDTGFSVGDQPPAPIDVIVSSGGLSLAGVVRDAFGKPVELATVVIVPSPPHRGNAALYKTARTKADGGFSITGIAPGDYTVFAWENIPATAYLNADFLARHEFHGQTVLVTAGNSSELFLKVITRTP